MEEWPHDDGPTDEEYENEASGQNEVWSSLVALRKFRPRVGASVMLIQNRSASAGSGKLVNGSRDTVIGYVRSDTIDGLPWASDLNDSAKVVAILKYVSRGTFMWPVVQFQNGVGTDYVTEVIKPCKFSVDDYHGTVLAERYQLPLLFGYAFTIHKGQGLNMPSVITDICDTFCHGQSYVALSRTRASTNICLPRVPPLESMVRNGVLVDATVLKFLFGVSWCVLNIPERL